MLNKLWILPNFIYRYRSKEKLTLIRQTERTADVTSIRE